MNEFTHNYARPWCSLIQPKVGWDYSKELRVCNRGNITTTRKTTKYQVARRAKEEIYKCKK